MKLSEKFGLLLATMVLHATASFAQINMADSTVQVIGYWDKGETQTYTITEYKYNIKENDTMLMSTVSFDVDITVTDSTASTYLMEWVYKNYKMEYEGREINQFFLNRKEKKALVRTNEMGGLLEIENWKELADELNAGYDKALLLMGDDINKKVNTLGVGGHVTSEEILRASAMKEIALFYAFHGGKYKFGEDVHATMQGPNITGGKPFDVDITVSVNELNADDGYAVLESSQIVNPEQLKTATLNALTKMAKEMNAAELPSLQDIPEMKNETYTEATIHNYGWPLFIYKSVLITAQSETEFREMHIEINTE